MSKKTFLFLFSHCSLSHHVSLTIFSYSLYFSLLFCLLTHSYSSSRLHLVLTFYGTSFFHSSCSLAKWPLLLFFHLFLLFFLSTCLTSLTSHLYLCGLTFVHPFINGAGLLYIIIEKKMNPILLFRTSYSSKPISLCWLLNTCPTSSFNELRQSVGWNMVQRTQHI